MVHTRSTVERRLRARGRGRGLEVVREAEDQLAIRRPPRAFHAQSFAGSRGPETQPRSPPLNPRALDPRFARLLTPIRGMEEDFLKVLSKPNSMSQGRLREEAETWGTQRQTEERVACAGPSPRHRIDAWLGLGERGCLWIRGSNCSPGYYEAEPSLPIPSPMPRHRFIQFTAPAAAVPR